MGSLNYLLRITHSFSALLLIVANNAGATPPSQADVDVYSSLCKIGSQSTVVVDGELGVISRRILGGEGKLSASKLQDEFPGVHDEKNRLLALQSFQDCMFRYVERFHGITTEQNKSASGRSEIVIGPDVSQERRREIVFLANELETFKGMMGKALGVIPASYYDKRNATEKHPADDPRLVGLADYSRYKAFQAASGGLDFSNATNNDLAILCDTYGEEIKAYTYFTNDYRALSLPRYASSGELRRICTAAARGR